MTNTIERQLKVLSTIHPSRAFTEESRRRIVGESARPVFSLPTLLESAMFGATMALTVLVALVAAGAGEKSPVARSIRSLDALESESREMLSTINLTLKEANYYMETADKAALALREAAKSTSGALDERIFEDSLSLPETPQANPEVEKLLDEAAN